MVRVQHSCFLCPFLFCPCTMVCSNHSRLSDVVIVGMLPLSRSGCSSISGKKLKSHIQINKKKIFHNTLNCFKSYNPKIWSISFKLYNPKQLLHFIFKWQKLVFFILPRVLLLTSFYPLAQPSEPAIPYNMKQYSTHWKRKI